jgi:hypothetical protein
MYKFPDISCIIDKKRSFSLIFSAVESLEVLTGKYGFVCACMFMDLEIKA